MYIGKKRVFYLTMGILCYMSNMAFAETVDTNVNKVDGEIKGQERPTHMMYCRIL